MRLFQSSDHQTWKTNSFFRESPRGLVSKDAFFFFFRMPLNPIRRTFKPRPYIFMTLLSFYHTSLNRLCSVRSEPHILRMHSLLHYIA